MIFFRYSLRILSGICRTVMHQVGRALASCLTPFRWLDWDLLWNITLRIVHYFSHFLLVHDCKRIIRHVWIQEPPGLIQKKTGLVFKRSRRVIGHWSQVENSFSSLSLIKYKLDHIIVDLDAYFETYEIERCVKYISGVVNNY